jgi:hypothetical protein
LSPPSSSSVRRLAVSVACLAALAVPAAAHATIAPLSAGFETADFSQVSQSSVLDGSLSITGLMSYDGTHAVTATYSGDSNNGYSRVVENVAWSPTENVWYGGAFYLPTGYLESLKGGNDIMRWDNWATYGSNADYGAIENWSDGTTRLILGKYTNDPGIVLGGPFHLPEGKWFWLEVHQSFSTVAGKALSDVYLNGQLISHSTAPNTFGRGADRVRWGIVCIDAGAQTTPLSLTFDRTTISSTEVGPLATTPPASPPAPAPVAPTPPKRHPRNVAHAASAKVKAHKASRAHRVTRGNTRRS